MSGIALNILKPATVILFLWTSSVRGAETDFVQSRHLKDSSEYLDQKMNDALLEIANETSGCNKQKLHETVMAQLGGFGAAQIESWTESTPNKGSANGGTIYDNTGQISGVCCSSHVKYKGTIVSGDKLGHFLHSGYEMYVFSQQRKGIKVKDSRGWFSQVFDGFADWTVPSFKELRKKINSHKKTGNPKLSDTEWALELSVAQEEGPWGRGTPGTGVYSHADIVANIEGLRFWQNLTDGSDPYFKCVGGKWTRAKPFTWSDYISAGWDEGINCNEYQDDPAMVRTIAARVDSLADEQKLLSNSCPLEPARCVEITRRYGQYPKMVSPKCRSNSGHPSPAGTTNSGGNR